MGCIKSTGTIKIKINEKNENNDNTDNNDKNKANEDEQKKVILTYVSSSECGVDSDASSKSSTIKKMSKKNV